VNAITLEMTLRELWNVSRKAILPGVVLSVQKLFIYTKRQVIIIKSLENTKRCCIAYKKAKTLEKFNKNL
jgi:hypothetical protein